MRRALPIASSLLAGLAALAVGQDAWPRPAEGWWEKLKAGDRAVYEVRQGPQTMRQVITVDKVDGSQVQYSTQTFLGDQPTPRQTVTIDARTDPDANGALPAEAQVKKGGEEKLEVAGRSYTCTVFEVKLPEAELKLWRCADLPPIFAGSNLKIEARDHGEQSSMTLVELTLASAAQ